MRLQPSVATVGASATSAVTETRGQFIARKLGSGWWTRHELARMIRRSDQTVDWYLERLARVQPMFRRRRQGADRRSFEYRTYAEAVNVQLGLDHQPPSR